MPAVPAAVAALPAARVRRASPSPDRTNFGAPSLIDRIAEMDLLGHTDAQIAAALRLKPFRVRAIRGSWRAKRRRQSAADRALGTRDPARPLPQDPHRAYKPWHPRTQDSGVVIRAQVA